MNYTYLTARQSAAILKDYLPHKVQVEKSYSTDCRRGELTSLKYEDDAVYASVRPANALEYDSLAQNILPVLYDLADLPRLPQRTSEDATPLVVFLRKLNFTASADLGAGEGVTAAEVIPNQYGQVADRTTLLHLRVQTGYIDPDTREEGNGGDYEVFVSAYGQVEWKNMTASKVSEQAGTGRTAWQEVNGSYLLLYAWDYLRELHVAIGDVAATERHPVAGTELPSHENRYRYVRKQLPAQEGGEQQ